MPKLSYNEQSEPAFGEDAAQTWSYEYLPVDGPDHIDFNGPCPKCRHASSYRWPLILVREELVAPTDDSGHPGGPAARRSGRESVLVRCQCEADHPGANGEKGCGRYWTLTVEGP